MPTSKNMALLAIRPICDISDSKLTKGKILMSDSNNHDNGDSKADAIASVVIICVVVTAVVYWLSSM